MLQRKGKREDHIPVASGQGVIPVDLGNEGFGRVQKIEAVEFRIGRGSCLKRLA